MRYAVVLHQRSWTVVLMFVSWPSRPSLFNDELVKCPKIHYARLVGKGRVRPTFDYFACFYKWCTCMRSMRRFERLTDWFCVLWSYFQFDSIGVGQSVESNNNFTLPISAVDRSFAFVMPYREWSSVNRKSTHWSGQVVPVLSMATPTLSDMLVRRTRLPDGAKFGKYCQKSLFSKNLPTLLAIFLCQNIAIFWNINCQYWQNNPFWIIYQMKIQTLERKYRSTLSVGNYQSDHPFREA